MSDILRLKHPVHPMTDFVREALNAEGLTDAYDARPAYQRNDYVGWIARAELAATREERLAQMLEELRAGDVYMHMAWRPQEVALDAARAVQEAQKSAQ